MTTLNMKYTLITGASQGMGLEMARECASLGRNILLISLPKENLKVLSENIADKFNVQTDFYEIDCDELVFPNLMKEHPTATMIKNIDMKKEFIKVRKNRHTLWYGENIFGINTLRFKSTPIVILSVAVQPSELVTCT